MLRLEGVLKKHFVDMTGIQLTIIGLTREGTTVSSINPSGARADVLAAYSADIIRRNKRLPDLFAEHDAIDYILIGAHSSKVLIKLVPDSECFLACALEPKTPLSKVLPHVNAAVKDSTGLLSTSRM